MGLREDIEGALGAIAASVPEAAVTMRHGEDECGVAVQSSSRDFASPVSESGPSEAAHYHARASDFPTLDEGSPVEIGGSLRVVVSMKRDAVGATLSLGMSAEFEKCRSSYTGTRRENGAARKIMHPLDVILLESGIGDNYSDSLAPTYAKAYLVAVRRTDWPEVSDPEPSDTIEVAPDGYGVALKVSSVSRHGGWYVLKCRARG